MRSETTGLDLPIIREIKGRNFQNKSSPPQALCC
ncbi:unnamed protein product [Tuber melanosporum]|uniref:(Perigord truffle) hypothetical protein n=1 Tax=Tuber melanosporum (strain Mel28) TaxID=656061 RepID=D5GKX3_TUBMM|nr:uncharacterized protein GSTUM_00009810001 [Tuber melanosporum]CAZ85166.1 unnamed protein product [Tuber melanosporum]